MSRIMFVDDDTMMLKMACFIMKKAGHEGLTASSGAEGLTKAAAEQPDMLFIDIEMPGMSGLELLEKLKADSATAGIPACLMSGTVTDEIRAKAAELGAAGVIGKPLRADEIKDAIAKVL